MTVVIRVFRVGLLIPSRKNSRNSIRFVVACVVCSVAKYWSRAGMVDFNCGKVKSTLDKSATKSRSYSFVFILT
jgi:hypothetical protein